MNPKVRGALIGLLLLAGICVGTAYVVVSLDRFRAPTREQWNNISIGDTDATVRSALGKPFREYDRDNAPSDFYIPGYGRHERTISGKVLIYRGADMVLYVWLDPNGRVEDMFRSTS